MKKFNHPHIVKIIEVEENGKYKFDIIQEYCEKGNMEDYLRDLYDDNDKLSEREIAIIMFQVGSAILCMHLDGMIHRDIKDANILITSEEKFMLADLGQSRTLAYIKSTVSSIYCGTAGY